MILSEIREGMGREAGGREEGRAEEERGGESRERSVLPSKGFSGAFITWRSQIRHLCVKMCMTIQATLLDADEAS